MPLEFAAVAAPPVAGGEGLHVGELEEYRPLRSRFSAAVAVRVEAVAGAVERYWPAGTKTCPAIEDLQI